MWTNKLYTNILSTSFKRIRMIVNDGTVFDNNKNPSTTLIVTLHINNKSINAIADTGSANSVIHTYIKYQKNMHRAANNTELCTIGLVKLKMFQHLY